MDNNTREMLQITTKFFFLLYWWNSKTRRLYMPMDVLWFKIQVSKLKNIKWFFYYFTVIISKHLTIIFVPISHFPTLLLRKLDLFPCLKCPLSKTTNNSLSLAFHAVCGYRSPRIWTKLNRIFFYFMLKDVWIEVILFVFTDVFFFSIQKSILLFFVFVF